MAFAHSPKISANNLVFYYDTSNGKSFPGEPTTNLTTDTPTQNGWAGSYSVLNSSRKTFQMQLDQGGADTAWRSWYWDVSSYQGSYITISFDFEVLETSGADLLYFVMGQGNTGTYPNFIASSAEADKVTDSSGVSRHFTWSGVINTAGLVGCTMRMTNGVSGGYVRFKLSNVQIEAKDHETPFVNGTRPVATGLKDLAGKTSMDLTNVSFDSSAQMTFDGSDDQIVITDVGANLNDFGVTFEMVWKQNSINTSSAFGEIVSPIQLGIRDLGVGPTLYFQLRTSVVQLRWQRAASDATISPSTPQESGVYGVYVGVLTSTGVSFYKNGILIGTTSHSKTFLSWYDNTIKIGNNAYNTYFDGDIPLTKIYNRALTAAEIQANFNAIKGRFGI